MHLIVNCYAVNCDCCKAIALFILVHSLLTEVCGGER